MSLLVLAPSPTPQTPLRRTCLAHFPALWRSFSHSVHFNFRLSNCHLRIMKFFSWKARLCAHIHAHTSCSVRSVTRIYDGGSSPAITFIFSIALSNYVRL